MEALRDKINSVSQRVEATKSTIQELQQSHDQQEFCGVTVRLEASFRRYNVKFFRLPEARQATDKEDTRERRLLFFSHRLTTLKC